MAPFASELLLEHGFGFRKANVVEGRVLASNLADHQRGTCTLRGIRRRLSFKMEGLARVSKKFGTLRQHLYYSRGHFGEKAKYPVGGTRTSEKSE